MVGFRVPGTTALVYMDSGTISCTYRYYCPYTITEMPQTCDRATSRHLQMFTVFIYIIYICIYIYVYVSFFINQSLGPVKTSLSPYRLFFLCRC